MRVVAGVTAAVGLAACLEAPPGGTDPADAGRADGAPETGDASLCPPLFHEPFDGTELDEQAWEPDDPSGQGTIRVGAGRLLLDANPAAGDDFRYLDVKSMATWPIAGLRVTATMSVGWEGNGDAILAFVSPGGYIGVYADSGAIGAATNIGGFRLLCEGGACMPYSLAAHRVWRVREAGGQVHFEVSSDGEPPWLAVGQPEATPSGPHAVTVWSECGPGNRVIVSVNELTVDGCGDE